MREWAEDLERQVDVTDLRSSDKMPLQWAIAQLWRMTAELCTRLEVVRSAPLKER